MKAKYIVLIALSAVLAGCAKWTTPATLDYTPAPKERDAQYVEDLLAFKAKKTHKVSLAMVASVSENPTRANQHVNAYPDSLDYIAMVGTEPLFSGIAAEMESVRKLGTKFLHVVDYSIAYEAWFENNLEIGEGFLPLLKEYTDKQIAALNAYNYEGIVISYLGKTSTDIEKTAQTQFLDACLAWKKAHPDAEMIFRGYARNLLDNSFLEDCKYLVIVPGANSSVGQLTVATNAQLVPGVPKDRLLMEVPIPNAVDGEWVGPNGQQAAAWVNEYTSGITKKGVAFSNAQDDYYHPDGIFPQIRDGINFSNK